MRSQSLPSAEQQRLDSARGRQVTRVILCPMTGCAEEFDDDSSRGFQSVTWGAVLDLDDGGSLALSWEEDALGDPFRIAVVDPPWLLGIESNSPEDVSQTICFGPFVGRTIDRCDILCYESNYHQAASRDTWHGVPWAVLLSISGRPLLVSAAHETYTFEGPPNGDNVVVAYSDSAIRRLRLANDGAESEWKSG